jgi:hypothetical protein
MSSEMPQPPASTGKSPRGIRPVVVILLVVLLLAVVAAVVSIIVLSTPASQSAAPSSGQRPQRDKFQDAPQCAMLSGKLTLGQAQSKSVHAGPDSGQYRGEIYGSSHCYWGADEAPQFSSDIIAFKSGPASTAAQSVSEIFPTLIDSDKTLEILPGGGGLGLGSQVAETVTAATGGSQTFMCDMTFVDSNDYVDVGLLGVETTVSACDAQLLPFAKQVAAALG